MLREYLPGLSLIEYTIIHSAPLQEMCGARKVPVLSLSREVKQALFFISKTQSGAVDKVSSENVQWEYGQKKRRPLASFHGPYQPLQVQSGR